MAKLSWERIKELARSGGKPTDDPKPAPKPNDPPTDGGGENAQLRADVASLRQEVRGLTGLLKDQQTAAAADKKIIEEQQAVARKKEIDDLLNAAVADGRITPEQKGEVDKEGTWAHRLSTSFDLSKGILGELPTGKGVRTSAQQTQGSDTSKGGQGNSLAGTKLARGVSKEFTDHVVQSVNGAE